MALYAEDKVWGWFNKGTHFDFAPDTGLGDFIENVAVTGVAIVLGIEFGVAVMGIGLAAYFFTDNLLLDDGDQYQNGRGIGSLDAFGLFCFRKLITRTQMQHLFQYSPLTLKGRPLLGGLPVFRKPYGPGSFIQHITSEVKEWYLDGVEGESLLALQEDQTRNPEFYGDL
jgi:hypothetical protein